MNCKRMKIRKRIIKRNCYSFFLIRTVPLFVRLSLISVFILGPAVIMFDSISLFWLVINMICTIGLLLVYSVMWYDMIRNMMRSKDRVFVNKMLKENIW